jgi:DNA-binding NarL/FixJ family response regulator
MVAVKPEPTETRTLRVCVVEDDPVVREQLVHQLSRAHGFTCLSSHRSAESALEEIPRHHPDVVLMDINLPKMSGIDCVRLLKGQLPNTQYVMLTVYEDADLISNRCSREPSVICSKAGRVPARTCSKPCGTRRGAGRR